MSYDDKMLDVEIMQRLSDAAPRMMVALQRIVVRCETDPAWGDCAECIEAKAALALAVLPKEKQK